MRGSEERTTAAAMGGAGAGAGAALVATVASGCCVGPVAAPLVVGILGASGAAWAATLKPYSPALLVGSGLLLGYAFWSLYRTRASCPVDEPADGIPEPDTGSDRGRWLRLAAVGVAWVAATIWFAALILNLVVT